MILTSTTIAIGTDSALIHEPTLKQLQTATSIHIFAFSSRGDLILTESEGKFNIHAWEEAADEAMHRCRGKGDIDNDAGDGDMNIGEDSSLEKMLKDVVEQKVRKDQEWKER